MRSSKLCHCGVDTCPAVMMGSPIDTPLSGMHQRAMQEMCFEPLDGWRGDDRCSTEEALGVFVQQHPKAVSADDGADRNVYQADCREDDANDACPRFVVDEPVSGDETRQRE